MLNQTAESLQKYINFIKLTSMIAIMIGGGIFSYYFFEIKYIPIMNTSSILYIFLIIPILLVLVVFFLAFYLAAAPAIWTQLFRNPRIIILLAGRRNLKNFISYKGNNLQISKNLYGIMRIWIIYLISLFGYITLTIYAKPLGYPAIGIFFINLSMISFLMCNSVFLNGKKNKPIIYDLYKKFGPSKLKKLRCMHAWLQMFFTIPFTALPLIIVVYLAIVLPHKELSHGDSNLYDLTCLFFVVLLSSVGLFPAEKINNIKKWLIITSITGSILICFYLGFLSLYPHRIINNFHLSSTNSNVITINENACRILKNAEFKIVCNSKHSYSVKGLKLMWRIGEAYVTFKDKKNIKKAAFFAAKDILGVSITLPNSKTSDKA